MEVIFWAIHGPKDIMHMFILYSAVKDLYLHKPPGDLYVN